MLNLLKKYIKRSDLFGKILMFEEKESQKHSTIGGIFLTCLLLITCIVIGFLFGKEIYERQNPTVINSKEFIKYSRVEIKDYPILFSYIFSNGTGIKDSESLFDIIIMEFTLNEDLQSSYKIHLGLTKRCNTSIYPDKYKSMVSDLYESNDRDPNGAEIYCLNKEGLFFQNPYAARNSTFLGVRFSKCNPAKRKCHPQMDEILKDMYIALITYDAFVDPNNYTHPIVYYPNVYSQQVSDAFTKRSYVNIEIGSLITHKGWLLENTETQEYTSIKDISKDVNPVLDRDIYRLTFVSNNLRTKDIRSYMKIQDLLAKIGGFYSALMLICYILSKDYVDFDYYISIHNHLKENGVKLIKKQFDFSNNKKRFEVKNFDKINQNNIEVVENNNLKTILKSLDKNMHINKNDVSSDALNNNFINNNELQNNNKNKLDKNNIPQQNVTVEKNFNVNLGNDSALNNNKSFDNLISPITIKKKSFSFEHLLVEDKISNNYFIYFWNDYICCKNTKLYKINEVKKVLSYNNVVEMSLEHYLKSQK